jgi:tRNA pseudouridine38-40 synthase
LRIVVSRLTIAYDGTGFAGWARQPGHRTVQEELEAALAQLRGGAPAPLTVAGRTDAGVHALAQVASYAGEPVAVRAVNALLPDDVAVLACERAPDGFDARRWARSRRYAFRVLASPVPSPFERRRAIWVPQPLDRDVLDACAAAVVGEHDFTAFTPAETQHVRFTRRVLHCAWREEDGGVLVLDVEADAFLRHMNRVLLGTMLQVARGRRDLDGFRALLEGAPRSAAGPTAPPHGLHFAGVTFGDGPLPLPWDP